MHLLQRTGAVAAAVVVITAVAPPGAVPQATLPDLLQRAGDYVASYAPKISGVVLDEEYLLIEIGLRGMRVPQRIESHVTFVDLYGKILALRDVFAVAGAPTRERTPRISEILAKPTPLAWQQAQQFAEQGHVHFLRDLIIRVSEPTIALQYLSSQNQSLFRWKIDGRRKLDGVEVVGLRFTEPIERNKQYFLHTVGNAMSSGRFWIDAATGRVHKSELWLESTLDTAQRETSETAQLEVTYAADAALGLMLPKSTVENYELREPGGGGVTLRHSITGNAKYANPRYSPIDLTRMR